MEKQKSSVVLLIFAAVFISVTLSFFLGQSGILRLRQLRNEYERLMMENHRLALENRKLVIEIEKLKGDPATMEKIAREELHYVSPNDIVLMVPEEH